MPLWLCCLLGGIFALVITILLYCLVFPEKRRNRLNRFFSNIKRMLGTEYLLIEKIVRFMYVLGTMSCIFVGFWMLFWVDYGYLGWVGLLVMILGPIVERLMFESCMMFILLVKNTMDIKKKLYNEVGIGNPPSQDGAPYGYNSPNYSQNYNQQNNPFES